MRDGISGKLVKRAISPLFVPDSNAIVSQIIDRQGFDALSFLIAIGAIADPDATFAVLVEDGNAVDNESAPTTITDAAAVADDELLSQTPGTAPEAAAGFAFADDDEVRKIGYVGNKRYVRLTLTPTSYSGASPAQGAYVSALAVLERASREPVVQAAS